LALQSRDETQRDEDANGLAANIAAADLANSVTNPVWCRVR
jgi:hypothetical protein